MKSAILIAAHGSPVPGTNDEVFRIAADVRSKATYDAVEACFLECNQPSISEAIKQCVELGVGKIVVLPYFLHPGRHVVLDIPAELERAMMAHPDIEFRLADYLGSSILISAILLLRASAASTLEIEANEG